MKPMIKKAAVLLCTLMCMVNVTVLARANENLDQNQKTSLTLTFGSPNPISGVHFDLYRVAEISDDMSYTPTEVFAKYQVELNGLDSDGRKAAAETLTAYVQRDAVEPVAEGETNSSGKLVFDNLEVGLYLVTGEKTTIGKYTYMPEPMLVQLPGDEDGKWNYHLTAYPKYGVDHDSPGGSAGGEDGDGDGGGGGGGSDTVTRKVLKIWNDNNWDQRPEDVVVQLLCNGKVYSTVTLNKDNHWKHVWTGLDKDDVWYVTEESVPEGYTVAVVREGVTFTVTNSYGQIEYVPFSPEIPLGVKLPQTGVLWWPIPLLAGCGLGLFLVGWLRRRREE